MSVLHRLWPFSVLHRQYSIFSRHSVTTTLYTLCDHPRWPVGAECRTFSFQPVALAVSGNNLIRAFVVFNPAVFGLTVWIVRRALLSWHCPKSSQPEIDSFRLKSPQFLYCTSNKATTVSCRQHVVCVMTEFRYLLHGCVTANNTPLKIMTH